MKRTSLIPSRGIAALALVLSTVLVDAQTRITPPDNSYSPAQDVELGQRAAAEARQQLPVLRDDAASSYLEDIGRSEERRVGKQGRIGSWKEHEKKKWKYRAKSTHMK